MSGRRDYQRFPLEESTANIQAGATRNQGRKKLLTSHEEVVLYRYIEAQAFAGFVADLDMIRQQIRTLVRLRKPLYDGPSDSFLQSFTHSLEFKQHIRSTVSKPIDHKRKTAHDLQELKLWMRAYRKLLIRYRILKILMEHVEYGISMREASGSELCEERRYLYLLR